MVLDRLREDIINGTLAAEGRLRTYPNPFRAG